MDEKLYGLMVVAEQQQAAVKAGIEGLVAERAALSQVVASFTALPGKLERAVAVSAGSAVSQSLAGAAEAVDAVLKPVVREAGAAEGQLRRALAAFSWKWVVVAGGATAGAIVAVALVAWTTIGWERRQLDGMNTQRVALAADIEQMQVNAADLASRGGRIKLDRCGPGGRLCVEIAPGQGKGMEDFRGSWEDRRTGRQFVIPKGY